MIGAESEGWKHIQYIASLAIAASIIVALNYIKEM